MFSEQLLYFRLKNNTNEIQFFHLLIDPLMFKGLPVQHQDTFTSSVFKL